VVPTKKDKKRIMIKPLEEIAIREIIDHAEDYPEISITLPQDKKISDNILNKTLEYLARCGRRDRCNISIMIKGNNTSAKTLFANSSDRVVIGK